MCTCCVYLCSYRNLHMYMFLCKYRNTVADWAMLTLDSHNYCRAPPRHATIWSLWAGHQVEVHFVTDQFQNIISPGFQWLTCSYLRHHTISVMHNVHCAVCTVHCKFSIFWYVWGLSAHCINSNSYTSKDIARHLTWTSTHVHQNVKGWWACRL